MMFAHGFGCDQAMWRYVAPHFAADYKVVTFDHVGAVGSDLTAYDDQKYATLQGYVTDVLEIGRELYLQDAVFVGHSVSAMIAVLACIQAPDMFSTLVLVAPSPCYIDDDGYIGGFSRADIDDLLVSLAGNPFAWSSEMAPAIMGNPDRPELGDELTQSFCRTNPDIALQFARVTFTSDNRVDLKNVTARTLILQCRDDIIAGENVGRYVHAQIAGSKLVMLAASGHCPNLSAPAEVVAEIHRFV